MENNTAPSNPPPATMPDFSTANTSAPAATTSEPVHSDAHGSLQHAGFWIRFAAAFIDGLILGVIGGILSTIFGGNTTVTTTAADGAKTVVEKRNDSAGGLIGLLYTTLFWKFKEATPGKMAMKLKVVRTDGKPLTWGNVILRYLGYIVSALPLLLGFFWVIWDKNKQGWHDKIAGTYVVKV